MTKIQKVMQFILAIPLLFAVSLAVAEPPKEASTTPPLTESQERLVKLQSSLAERLAEQSRLQKQVINQVNPDDAQELNTQLELLGKEISSMRKTFEHLAIGGADLSSFEEEPKEFNLQEEVVEITQPLLDMLKSLTEKPRKIEELKGIIESNRNQQAVIENALKSLQSYLAAPLPKKVSTAVQDIQARWQQKLADTQREIELAGFQLATLQGQNISWTEAITTSLQQFFKGRGLTLGLAILASLTVWLLTRLVLWLVKQGQRGRSDENRQKMHYRLAAYAFTLLTTLLIIATVILVFYIRGDILLLALSLIVLAAIVLSMRTFLPQYIVEAKLILNVGPVREGERTIYNGLPWEVMTINMYSVLRNPDLEGSLRLPLACLRDLTSRPNRGEAWFPSRKGDLVLLPDGLLAEVIRQTPDMVYLKLKGGMLQNVPACDFFSMGVLNLSRGESFVVVTIFGIDYEHQAICLSEVPNAFDAAVREAMRREGLSEHLNDVVVDFKAAGSSSLDYLVLVNVKSSAAPFYFKLERLLQQTCVKVCTQKGWGIPFPQLTVHQAKP